MKLVTRHSSLVTRHSVSRKAFAMLAALTLLAITFSSPRAQSFTQVSYNFPSAPDHATDDTSAFSTSLTMNSLAANGYGQWTSFPEANGSWGLLGNHLEDAAGTLACTYHGGIVQTGTLTNPIPDDPALTPNPDEIKVTTNLVGCTRYVCPDPTRNYFIVQGFNGQASSVDPQIDLSFKSGSNGMTLYDPPSTLPVKSSMVTFSTTISTYCDVQFNPVVPSSVENPRDELDVKTDGYYTYIVWESYVDGFYKVFGTVVSNVDGSVPSGLPVLLGSGRRPTVDVDVRNSPEYPTFDAAWITGPSSAGILYRTMLNGTLGTMYTLTTAMQQPGEPNTNYSYAYHARIVVGSALGADPSPNGPRAIYAIVDPVSHPGTGHLVLFKDVQRYTLGGAWTPEAAYYVDGSFLTALHPIPIDGNLFPVDDDPIIAFSNPYDGQGQTPPGTAGTTPYNEYHCTYRLHRTYSGTLTHDPLMIVRGADGMNGTVTMNECLNQAVPGWESIQRPDGAHAFSEDPTVDGSGVISYIGAVNQMGIHCHWRAGNHHYYMRDSRSFDEPIEEYTLETNATTVQDGTSHQSMYTNYPTRTMDYIFVQLALWGEPTTTEFANAPGSTLHDPVLNFEGDDAELQIGGSYVSESSLGQLITFPTFKVNFTSSNQLLLLDYATQFDYYGNSIAGNLEHFSFSGPGPLLPTVQLQGYAASLSVPITGYALYLTSPARLNIHGGCWFTTTTSINFTATNSEINSLDEAEVGSVSGAVGDGSDYCIGPQTISSSIISGGIAGETTYEPDIIMVRPCSLTGDAMQFSLSNSLVQNIGSAGGVTCDYRLISGSSTQYSATSISDCKFNGARVMIADPSNSITIFNTIFDNIDWNGDSTWGYSPPITIHNPSGGGASDPFLPININNCDFRDFISGNSSGILVSGFGPRSTDESNIMIGDNTFVTAGTVAAGQIYSAIEVENSSAWVTGNTINQNIYEVGIYHHGYGRMPSFICSNQISNLTADANATGLIIADYGGYTKLNVIENCSIGISDDFNDKGHVDICNIENCNGYGMDIFGHPDLTGVHHTDPSLDYAAFNVIKNNDIDDIYGEYYIQIHLNSGALIDLGQENPLWTVYGYNDIEIGPDIWYDVYSDDGLSANIADISSNYWGTYGNVIGATYVDLYDLPSVSPPYFVCGSTERTKPKNTQTLSEQLDSSSCLILMYKGEDYDNDPNYQAEVDTLEYFIEECYAQPFSYEVFGNIESATAQLYPNIITDNERFLNVRNWLFSVLYLNLDTIYYCSDVNALIGTFDYQIGSRGLDWKGLKAVEEYIVASGKCPILVSEFNSQIKDLSQQIYLTWKDTVQDSLLTPFDTTLPTLQQIGFEALLGPQYDAVHNGILPTSVLGTIGVVPNPFQDNTVINYTLNVPATLTVEVFNTLGKRVAAPVPSVFTNNGEYSLTLTGSGLASGTYYVRFSVPEGEVQTIKVSKE